MVAAASSSRLPAYPAGPVDVLSRVASLEELHPDPSHPSRMALLPQIDLRKDSALLWANSQGGITVTPQAMSHTDFEGWTLESGYLVVVSTSRRRIDRLAVKLIARQSLQFPQDGGDREVDEAFTREVTLEDDAGGLWLDKGVNTFAFVLNLPPDMCLSMFEHQAQIRHYVVATAVGSAKGRLFGKDLTVEERVYAMASPAHLEDLIFDHSSTGFTDELGPWALHASSSLFTVAGGVFLSLTLASPPPDIRIYALRLTLDQTLHMTSFRDARKTGTLRKSAAILERGWSGPYNQASLDRLRKYGKEKETILFDGAAAGASAEGWVFEDVGRLAPDSLNPPDALYVRASSYDNTKTCVRVSNELVVEVFFSKVPTPATPKPNLLIGQLLRRPVHLHSCACLPGRLLLPDYEPTTKSFVPVDDTWIPCRCTESLEDIRATEWAHVRAMRAAAERGHVDVTDVKPGRKIGELS